MASLAVGPRRLEARPGQGHPPILDALNIAQVGTLPSGWPRRVIFRHVHVVHVLPVTFGVEGARRHQWDAKFYLGSAPKLHMMADD